MMPQQLPTLLSGLQCQLVGNDSCPEVRPCLQSCDAIFCCQHSIVTADNFVNASTSPGSQQLASIYT